MKTIFGEYTGLIIGVIVGILVIGVGIVVSYQFKDSSTTQFSGLDSFAQEKLEEIQETAPVEP